METPNLWLIEAFNEAGDRWAFVVQATPEAVAEIHDNLPTGIVDVVAVPVVIQTIDEMRAEIAEEQ